MTKIDVKLKINEKEHIFIFMAEYVLCKLREMEETCPCHILREIVKDLKILTLDETICEQMMKYVEEHPEFPWNWQSLTWNPNLTMTDVERHLDQPWDWGSFILNPTLTMNFIERHLDQHWDWTQFSRRMFTNDKRIIKEHLMNSPQLV